MLKMPVEFEWILDVYKWPSVVALNPDKYPEHNRAMFLDSKPFFSQGEWKARAEDLEVLCQDMIPINTDERSEQELEFALSYWHRRNEAEKQHAQDVLYRYHDSLRSDKDDNEKRQAFLSELREWLSVEHVLSRKVLKRYQDRFPKYTEELTKLFVEIKAFDKQQEALDRARHEQAY